MSNSSNTSKPTAQMYYAMDIETIFNEFSTSENGLSFEEVRTRMAKYGENTLKQTKKISPLSIFLNQFKGFIVGILIAAIVISVFIQEYLDAQVIAVILILNAILGFIQEYRAERSIEALKKLISLKAKVIRDGRLQEIPAAEVVPGDILVLEEGAQLTADARLILSINLETQEASLTGESTPVEKNIDLLEEHLPVADQKNMVFSSTIITRGRGRAVVVATGMETEIGKIAEMIQEAEKGLTPLQLSLKQLGHRLGMLTLGICFIVFIVGAMKTGEYLKMFIAAIALAVAAIPEGLPAVVTISLALGVERMIKKNALLRKLPSVETLGCTTVICSDKTGTLTCNQMTVERMFVNDEVISVTGSGYLKERVAISPEKFELLLRIGALCNDANINDANINDANIEEKKVIGDPTEASLIVNAAKAGLIKQELEKMSPRVAEIPFDSKRKMMTTIHQTGDKLVAYTKGAPDILLERCTQIYINGKIMELTAADKEKIYRSNEGFAQDALRVLGFAFKETQNPNPTEDNLIFVGLQAMIDPPRKEVKEAIKKCRIAGIKVIMITGDHKLTALAIATKLGIIGEVLTGKELDEIEDLYEEIVEKVSIYARVSPEHKMKIIEALKRNGHVVAMTGDGVNDAPALKEADIGIAMGITGTDVAKEASDMILTDDNFASIVNAVEEGRTIEENIKKFVTYLLSSNLGEVLTIFIAIIIGLPMPLLALQILWINLMTDGLPALALGIDPPDIGLMKRKPRRKDDNILSTKRFVWMLGIGLIMMISTLGIFHLYKPGENLDYARTIAFTTLMMLQMFNVMNCRSGYTSVFRGFFSNLWLLSAIVISITLQLLVIYTPLSGIFHTMPITLIDWGYILLVSASVLVFGEIVKVIRHWTRKRGGVLL
ncbi:MAG: calcium-translocating P-type ATPase, SERCA-type [bacterium]|nr:calcium-translocating P-type ATPase, SERCA-type [bacterium]